MTEKTKGQHGGSRPGAGRPPTGRTLRTLRATDEEWELIKSAANQIRRMKQLPSKIKVIEE